MSDKRTPTYEELVAENERLRGQVGGMGESLRASWGREQAAEAALADARAQVAAVRALMDNTSVEGIVYIDDLLDALEDR